MKFVKNEKIVPSLKQFESEKVKRKFTIAVLYCREGQTNEIEMFSNG